MKFKSFIILLLVLICLSSCVQETHIKTITFELDARTIENMESIGIRGNMPPLSWNENFQLTDKNGDSIYTATMEINTAQNQLRFKFVKNASEFELENQDNRLIPFDYKPETILYQTKFDSTESQITKN
ncbi:MAG: hypothetical protein HKO90_02275 [Flavobacteriaceae bacterium]|nr:hypothetical protein [Flavobacteriaceae bacterium]